jgi:predicted O-methyltransferase YrrM
MNTFLNDLKIIDDYMFWVRKFKDIEGYLSWLEGYTLMTLASNGAGMGEILEIGSYMGKSTCWLATGAKISQREIITAIDHFIGSGEHQEGAEHETRVLKDDKTTFNKFKENLDAMQVSDYVNPIVAGSEEAVKGWNKVIRLLFIDGDHSYESVKRDFELWSPFVCRGGYVCFHDVGTWEGPTKYYDELIKDIQGWIPYITLDSIRVLQRLQ